MHGHTILPLPEIVASENQQQDKELFIACIQRELPKHTLHVRNIKYVTKAITEIIYYLVIQTGLWAIQLGSILEHPWSHFRTNTQAISSFFFYTMSAQVPLSTLPEF